MLESTPISTDTILKPYMQDNKRHKAYSETCKIAQDLRIHSDGENAGDLVSERRPSESEEIKKYRAKIFVAITEPVVSRIITSLSKIRRSSDWSIKYDVSKFSKTIIDGETLQDYCEENYPGYESITKWTFDVLLKNYLVDPNSVLAVIHEPVSDITTYKEPIAIIFNSENVYDFVENKFTVLYSTDKCEYKLADNSTAYDGDVYYYIDATRVQRWEQTDAKKTMTLKWEYAHNQSKMPAFKLKGLFYKSLDNVNIFKSRINAIIPHLKEAVREYSDLQAGVVQSLHLQKWFYQSQKCSSCGSTGKLIVEGKTITCDKCKGSGYATTSPYDNIKIPLPEPGMQPVSMPPAGYIAMDTKIIEIQDARVDKHKYQALAAINMEFLAETPLNQSGVAKEVDRDELNTFVNSIAEDLISIMDKIYYFINEYRYFTLVHDKNVRKEMLPKIAVPQNYDLLSANYLLQELQAAKTAKINIVSQIALEVEFANKKFNNDPAVRDELKCVLELDPLPGLTDDEKLLRLQNDGIIRDDYVLSANINSFVKKAIEENKDFLSLNHIGKREFLQKYIDATLIFNSTSQQIINGVKITNGAPNLMEAMKGITGMIEIATAVSEGVLSMDGAILLASEKFGITTDQAKAQLKGVTIQKPAPPVPPVPPIPTPLPPVPPAK